MVKMPTVNHNSKNRARLPIFIARSSPSKVLLTTIAGRTTNIRMATRSSTTKAPKTNWVNFLFFIPKSSKALIIMEVEDMLSIPPRKMDVTQVQPKSLPTRIPTLNITITSVNTVMNPAPPTFFIFFRLNSRPNPKRRNITPIFPQNSTLSTLLMVGIKVM